MRPKKNQAPATTPLPREALYERSVENMITRALEPHHATPVRTPETTRRFSHIAAMLRTDDNATVEIGNLACTCTCQSITCNRLAVLIKGTIKRNGTVTIISFAHHKR